VTSGSVNEHILHSAVLADYRDFVRSFFLIADPRARAFVDQALDEESRLWPDFLLQVSPSCPSELSPFQEANPS